MATSDEPDLRQIGDDLHQQLLDGDVTASARIAETFLSIVISKLQHKYPNLNDPHLVDTAVDDAILNYLGRPHQYDSSQLPLDRFLLMAAEGDLLNLLRGVRFSGLPKKLRVVELDASEREYGTEVEDGALSVEDQVQLLTSPVWSALETLFPQSRDRDFIRLMMDGERSTAEFADLLGVKDWPKEQQEAEVKRHKDRIKKTLQRHIRRSDLEES